MYAREPSVSPPKNARKQSQAPKKRLNYYKCKQCRQDRQRCDEVPESRVWPGQKCHRCKKYGYACSENVDSEGNPIPLGRSQVSPSSSPGPYSRSSASHHAISQSMHHESISGYADPSSSYDVYTSHPGSYPAYITSHDMSSIPDMRSGSIHSLPTSESALAQSSADIPSIHFTWLHNCNFQGYVSGQITEEGTHSVRRLYGMISSRRRAIQAYADRLMIDNSVYSMSAHGDYDQYHQQHQQRLMAQQATGHYNSSYDLGNNQVDIYTVTPLDRSYQSHSSYNPSSSRTSLSIANNQQSMTITTNLTEVERIGLRWKELITELRSEDVLLIDPFYSASFEHLIKHGSDEEFYNTRLHLSAPSSYARELCLRLSGIVNMIEELKATRATMSPETRGYIAYNIDTRIEKVIPLSLASLDIKDSPHSSLGQYDESEYGALEPGANVNVAFYN